MGENLRATQERKIARVGNTMFLPCFLRLWLLALMLRSSAAAPESGPRYGPVHDALTFERAQEACGHRGLASFAKPGEFVRLLKSVPAGPSVFWVGLKKAKNQCVVPSLPLRGFKWARGGGEDADDTSWAREPEQTCTSVLCAGLSVESDGSRGLIPLSCKSHHPFICNLESQARPTTEPAIPRPTGTPQPAAPGTELLEPPMTATTEPGTVRTESAAPKTQRPDPATPGPDKLEPSEKSPGLAEPPTPESTRPEAEEPENRPDGFDGSESESVSCPRPAVAGARFLTLDPDNSGKIRVDCWSKVRLELHCRHPAGGWRLPGGAPANLSSVCTPCPSGYRKNVSGDCEDVDECSGPHGCRDTCVNTAGSFKCVCADPSGSEDRTECEPAEAGDPGPFSGVLVPALVGAGLLLLVLLLVALVTVKCCLKRRRKKDEETKDKLAT
ncbi:C-type lectin domain family 14 member A [Corythoichthys intestinalis]|uniref:C-type lectin domain family 14 member A n=1 Tax=Corythoichthys intestinalis TaxID=161448 RepID=UPI0025A640CC|nr:C-type lectin domain family 14 member A [Corythoichthys intestinalis]